MHNVLPFDTKRITILTHSTTEIALALARTQLGSCAQLSHSDCLRYTRSIDNTSRRAPGGDVSAGSKSSNRAKVVRIIGPNFHHYIDYMDYMRT